MTLEQLEFAITQYLDGTLPADEVGALERRLADADRFQPVTEFPPGAKEQAAAPVG